MGDHSTSRGTIDLVADGWRRVGAAPLLVMGIWLLTLAVTWPSARALERTISADLGPSASGTTALNGVDASWWLEFRQRHPEEGATFRPSVIGFAAVLRNISGFADNDGPDGQRLVLAVVYGALWLFFWGGILDRYARRRRVGAHAFFGTCGVFFWRFIRLALIAGLVYWLLFGVIHGLLFDRLYPWMTRDLDTERTAFLIRVLLYAVFAVPVAALVLLFDLAKARAVVEDRRSMLGAVLAAARLLRRHPLACIAPFLLNVALFLVVLLVYAFVAPGAGGGNTLSFAYMVFIGEVYVAARLAVRLAFGATAVAIVQDRLAHAGYTSAPIPVWPDSPAAEAVSS
jgi:hypothetical protein